MQCPFCKTESSKVIETRESKESTRRRRECNSCNKRFTTYERVESLSFNVVKKNGRKEQFDGSKILRGIQFACEKRIPEKVMKEAAKEIEQEILCMDEDITTTKIGKLVVKKLKQLDNIAYLRFVSVYNDFKDASQFRKELEKLAKNEV